MEEKIKQYLEFDFNENQEWRKFVEQFTPTPSEEEMEQVKRLWYQKVVDKDFDINYDQDEAQPEDQNNNQDDNNNNQPQENSHDHNNCCGHQHPNDPSHQHSHSENQQQQQQNQQSGQQKQFSLIFKAAYHLENFLKFSFITTSFFQKRLANWILLIVCILALIRQLKRPRWNKEYARKLAVNEFFHNLLYMIPFVFFPSQRDLLYFFPIMLHFWIGICEYINIVQGPLYKLVNKAVTITLDYKKSLIIQKSKFEIYLMIFNIVFLFIGRGNLFMLVFYANFLRIKYVLSSNLQQGCNEINNYLGSKLDKPNSPRIFKWILKQFRRLCAYLVSFGTPKPPAEKTK